MAKTSINVRACNIGCAERHNLRSKELDYIRPELSYRNEQWSEMKIAETVSELRQLGKVHNALVHFNILDARKNGGDFRPDSDLIVIDNISKIS